MKTCKGCGIEKPESEYHSPYKRFLIKKHEWLYTTRTYCKLCERLYNFNRYQNLKDAEEFKIKNRYYAAIGRKTDGRRAYMKKYLHNYGKANTEKNKVKTTKYQDKIQLELSPVYIRRKIFQESPILRECEIPQELIKLKQKKIKAWRTLKELKN